MGNRPFGLGFVLVVVHRILESSRGRSLQSLMRAFSEGKRCKYGHHLCWREGCHRPQALGKRAFVLVPVATENLAVWSV